MLFSISPPSPPHPHASGAHFDVSLLETLAVGVVTLVVQVIRIYASSVNGVIGRVMPMFYDSSVLLLGLATVATVVCWAIRRAAPHPQSLETAVLRRMTLITGRRVLARLSPANPQDGSDTVTSGGAAFLITAATWANSAITSGGLSLLWCFVLLWGVLSFQYAVINACLLGNLTSTSVVCQTYTLGSFPLVPMLHAVMFSLFMLFVSCKPLLTAVTLILSFASVCTQSWLLYPRAHTLPIVLNLATTAACAAALMGTILLFSFSIAYQRRQAFYRLYSMAVAFDRYDTKGAKLRAAEVRRANVRREAGVSSRETTDPS